VLFGGVEEGSVGSEVPGTALSSEEGGRRAVQQAGSS
jgi:hypothetical protein